MLIQVLRCKIHNAKVTGKNVNYEGSLTLGRALLEKSGLLPYERIEVYNITNGERFSTYIIPGEKDGYEVILNGAAARKGEVGDRIIIAAYAIIDGEELKGYKPRVLILDDKNMPVED